MVALVHLTRCWLNGQWWIGQKIVRAMHTALGRGLLVLLNGHKLLHISNSLCLALKALEHRKR